MYMLVYTCPPVFGLYLAVVRAHVNCCQVLCCLRAQHPLCCPSWLIWVGSTMCHSLALIWWTCLHGLVRKIGPLPNEARGTQCQMWNKMPNMTCVGILKRQGSSRVALNIHLFSQREEELLSLFQRRQKIECFSVFIFKLQGVRKNETTVRGA